MEYLQPRSRSYYNAAVHKRRTLTLYYSLISKVRRKYRRFHRGCRYSKTHPPGASFREHVLRIVQNKQAAEFLENRKQCGKMGRGLPFGGVTIKKGRYYKVIPYLENIYGRERLNL